MHSRLQRPSQYTNIEARTRAPKGSGMRVVIAAAERPGAPTGDSFLSRSRRKERKPVDLELELARSTAIGFKPGPALMECRKTIHRRPFGTSIITKANDVLRLAAIRGPVIGRADYLAPAWEVGWKQSKRREEKEEENQRSFLLTGSVERVGTEQNAEASLEIESGAAGVGPAGVDAL